MGGLESLGSNLVNVSMVIDVDIYVIKPKYYNLEFPFEEYTCETLKNLLLAV